MTVTQRPAPGPPREYHFPPFTRWMLANGLRVIIAPVNKLPVVTVLAVIDAGASTDPAGQEGLAQLTAEALREGTEKHTGIEILENVERLGSSLEAGADWDGTIVSMTILREHLSAGHSILAEVLTSASFPDHEVDRLKAERLAERLQILSEPRSLADESLSKFLYAKGSRYREPMSGNRQSTLAIKRSDVVNFFGSRYTPDAVTVIMVGDIGIDEGIDLIKGTLGDWRGKRTFSLSTSAREARDIRALEIVAKADAAQAELRFGHAGMARNHPDYFNVVVMNSVLGGLFSSRINLNLREKHGYTYGASSFYDWRRIPGPFIISTAVQTEIVAEAIRETLNEIEGIRSQEISADELSLATSYLEGVFPIRYETTSAIASALANLVIFELPEGFYDGYRQNIRNVSPADVLKAAQTHLFPEKLQIVVVGDSEVVRAPVENLAFGNVSLRAAVES